MIVTEEEAKALWCPFSRATMYVRGDLPETEKPVDLVGHAANRIILDDVAITEKIQGCIDKTGATRCLGSRCMAWRWAPQKRVPRSQLLKDADPRVVAFIKAERFIDAIKEHRSQSGEPLKEAKDYCERLRNEMLPPTPVARRGYCGLAGKVTP